MGSRLFTRNYRLCQQSRHTPVPSRPPPWTGSGSVRPLRLVYVLQIIAFEAGRQPLAGLVAESPRPGSPNPFLTRHSDYCLDPLDTRMNLTWDRLTLKLSAPFRTAKAYRTDKETLWVKVTQNGVTGWGEAVPVDTYHQTLESAERTLSAAARMLSGDAIEIERAKQSFAIPVEQMLADALAEFDDQLATVAAIDAALHDWVGKRFGVPTYRWLGLSPQPIPRTSFTLGIEDDLDLLAKRVRTAGPYPILKVKLGTPHDEEILRIIRQEAPEQTLRVDANMAWSVEEALSKLPMLASFGVEFVEQPLAAEDHEGLRRLTEARILPIFADESCVRPADVLALAGRPGDSPRANCVDGINIKLSKCGGIRQAMTMIRLARLNGIKVMLGCMLESTLGIAAALQLAPLADHLDLDGHLLLAEDPFEGIGGEGGRLMLSEKPGLGVARRVPEETTRD